LNDNYFEKPQIFDIPSPDDENCDKDSFKVVINLQVMKGFDENVIGIFACKA